MAKIDRIVNVSIALNTAGLSKEGFSTMLIVGPHSIAGGRVQSFAQASDLIDSGFAETDPIYIAAEQAFSQIPAPSVVKVGQLLANVHPYVLPAALTVGNYTVGVQGKDVDGSTLNLAATVPVTTTDAATEIVGMITAINTQFASSVVTASLGATPLTIDLTVAEGHENATFTITFKNPASANITAGAALSSETFSEAMVDIVASDSDWFGVIATTRDESQILDVLNEDGTVKTLGISSWCEANKKLFGTCTAATGAADGSTTTDLISKLKAKNYSFTYSFYHSLAASEYPEAAIMARCFAINPGGETWANKRLYNITSDKLTETQYNAVTKKNGNTFEPFRNLSISQNGKVASGEWIDVIRFMCWLQEEIKTNVFTAMINADKIPYTDDGIAIIEKEIYAACTLGQTRKGIAPTEYDDDGNINKGFEISVPLAADISSTNKANRTLEDVTFTARLAGAIHNVTIKGNFTYNNLITESVA